MRTLAMIELKTPVRLVGYLLLGGLGALALMFPLFGALAYFASFLLPVLVGWVIYGGVLAAIRQPRMARIYVFGNLGILAASVLVYIAGLIIFATGVKPDTDVTAPLYLAVVLAGLVVGIVFGARRPKASAPSSERRG